MTRAEIVTALKDANIAFDARAKKADLQEVYDQNFEGGGEDYDKVPLTPFKEPVTQKEREPEYETDADGEFVLDGEGNKIEKPPPPLTQDDIDELFSKIEGAEAPQDRPPAGERPLFEQKKRKIPKGKSQPDSFRVEGYVLLLVTDTVFPFTFSFLNNMLDKKNKIQASDMQLNEVDFKKLEPLADQAADYMSIGLNPIAGFFLVATFMYSNNLIALKMQLQKS